MFALIGAANQFYDIEWYENVGFLAAGIVLLGGGLLTAQTLYETIINIV